MLMMTARTNKVNPLIGADSVLCTPYKSALGPMAPNKANPLLDVVPGPVVTLDLRSGGRYDAGGLSGFWVEISSCGQ